MQMMFKIGEWELCSSAWRCLLAPELAIVCGCGRNEKLKRETIESQGQLYLNTHDFGPVFQTTLSPSMTHASNVTCHCPPVNTVLN